MSDDLPDDVATLRAALAECHAQMDEMEDTISDLCAERDALRAEVARLRAGGGR